MQLSFYKDPPMLQCLGEEQAVWTRMRQAARHGICVQQQQQQHSTLGTPCSQMSASQVLSLASTLFMTLKATCCTLQSWELFAFARPARVRKDAGC